jgi:hypothetical protein
MRRAARGCVPRLQASSVHCREEPVFVLLIDGPDAESVVKKPEQQAIDSRSGCLLIGTRTILPSFQLRAGRTPYLLNGKPRMCSIA